MILGVCVNTFPIVTCKTFASLMGFKQTATIFKLNEKKKKDLQPTDREFLREYLGYLFYIRKGHSSFVHKCNLFFKILL